MYVFISLCTYICTGLGLICIYIHIFTHTHTEKYIDLDYTFVFLPFHDSPPSLFLTHTQGFPVFVILDCKGGYVHTQSAGPLELDPIFTASDPDPNKVLAFLVCLCARV